MTDKSKAPEWSITPEQTEAVQTAVTTARDLGQSARTARIDAWVLAFTLDIFGEDRLYPTQGAYAEALGVSGGAVTQEKRLALFKVLGATDADLKSASSVAGTKVVGAALTAKGATLTKVRKAVTEAKRANAEKAAEKTGTPRPPEPVATEPEPVDERTPGQVALDAIRAVSDAVKGLTPEEWQAARKGLMAVIDREDLLQAKAAEQAA